MKCRLLLTNGAQGNHAFHNALLGRSANERAEHCSESPIGVVDKLQGSKADKLFCINTLAVNSSVPFAIDKRCPKPLFNFWVRVGSPNRGGGEFGPLIPPAVRLRQRRLVVVF